MLQKFSKRVSIFNEIDGDKKLSIKEMAYNLQWKETTCFLFKYKFSSLSKSDIEILDKISFKIDDEIIGAICLCPTKHRTKLLNALEDIHKASNPFEKIDEIVATNTEKHPLENISSKFWKHAAKYLEERGINNYPFNKTSIRFLKSVSRNGGFKNQSAGQKKWILGLLDNDKKGFDVQFIFNNDFLKAKGFENDCEIIKKYYACL